MKNGLIKNITTGIFEIRKYAFLNSSKRVWAEKSSLVFWNSKAFFYKYLKQGMKEKHSSRYFQIAQYPFLNIWKRVWAKICHKYFQIRPYAFSNIWKRLWAKELSQVFLRFVSMLFEVFKKVSEEKNCPFHFSNW